MNDPLTPYGNRPMVTPIVNAVNYEYRDFEVLRRITDGEIDGYTYHRDDNPTVRAVEKKVAALEGAEDCVVCTSGMAACTLVYLTYLKSGDNLILFHDIYGAHYKVSLILERLGIQVTWIDADRSPDLAEHIRPNTAMIFIETPSNPLCKIVDIAAARGAADKSVKRGETTRYSMRLEEGQGVHAIDLMGSERTLVPDADGLYSVEVGIDPIYLLSTDDKIKE